MLKIFKYLKKYSLFIVVIIALLVAQAALDLSLPDYMSKIVNVGIQQGGINKPYPEVIRESEVAKLKVFLTDEEDALFDRYYKPYQETSDTKLSETYPGISTQKSYYLVKDDSFNENTLSFLNKNLVILYAFGNIGGENSFIPSGSFPNLPAGMNPIDAIMQMPDQARKPIIDSITAKLSIMPAETLAQTAALFSKTEYGVLGANLDKIQSNYIFMAGLQMIGIAFLGVVVAILVSLIASRVSAGLGRDLRYILFGKVMSYSSEEFNEFSTASLITRSTNDIQQVQTFTVLLLRMVFYAPILGVGGIIKALNTNKSMAWVIAVGVMAILTLIIILFATALPKFKAVQKLVDKVNLVVRDSLVGMLVIRAFNTEKYEEKKFGIANDNLTKTNLFVARLMGAMQPMMMLIMNGISILIIWVGAIQVDAGNMQVGDMMAYIQYTMQIMMSFLMLSMVSIILPRATVSINRITEVIDKSVAIKDPVNPLALPESIKGEVEFKNVSFKYPGADEDVLKDISFTAHYGQTTAFIGSTGSGKSTVVNLIPRFYDVTEGEVLLNGENIKELRQHDLRERISYVPQKGILFSGTIESNIKYADENLSDEAMRKAAQIAQAEDFIDEKEDKYQSNIAQGGTNVSGGQRQRLSIARALAANAEVIIFDDSFSALDYKTDNKLRSTLKKEINNTVIIVAQRISTIKNADKIIVLDEGRIVGQGTHDELMKNCSVYQEIASSQLSKEELAS